MSDKGPWAADAFAGQAILITGAGSGMGRAAALQLASLGADVVLAGRRKEPLTDVAREVERIGGRSFVRAADVADPAQVEALIKDAASHFGRLDGAWNNAGIEGTFSSLREQTIADIGSVIDTNLTGVMHCVKFELDAMIESGSGGSIVNTSSWLAHGAMPGSTAYSASKAGLDGFTRAVALEASSHRVRINNVNPGIIDTPMFRRFCEIGQETPFTNHTPMRRLGTPEDVAEVVVWLLSDAARFVTGQNVLVDGGYAISGQRPWASE